MNYTLYINCAAIGVLGTVLSMLVIAQNLQRKAKLANVQFNISQFLKDDWLTPVSSFTMIAMGLIVLQYAPPTFSQLWLIGLFATAGYTGSDLASRLFSVANKRINSAIDYKTTIADESTGTARSPTPAVLPEKKP